MGRDVYVVGASNVGKLLALFPEMGMRGKGRDEREKRKVGEGRWQKRFVCLRGGGGLCSMACPFLKQSRCCDTGGLWPELWQREQANGAKTVRGCMTGGSAAPGKSAFVRAILKEMGNMSSMQFDPAATRWAKRAPTESAMPGTTLRLIPLSCFATGEFLYGRPQGIPPLETPHIQPALRRRFQSHLLLIKAAGVLQIHPGFTLTTVFLTF